MIEQSVTCTIVRPFSNAAICTFTYVTPENTILGS